MKKRVKERLLNELGDIYKKILDEINNNVYVKLDDIPLNPLNKIANNLKTIFKFNILRTFDFSIYNCRIEDCIGFNITKNIININQYNYFSYQISFTNSSNKTFSIHSLDIMRFLNFKVIHKGVTIYSLSDEIKKTITDFKEKIEFIKSINN